MKLFVIFALLVLTIPVAAQLGETEQSWNQPVEPFKIAGNIYYVGASDITSYLITTPKGHILLDSGFRETVPQITQNIKKLGFKLEDVKYLVNSHAHYDHAGGLGELKRLTKAKLLISEPDAGLLANGGKADPNFGDQYPFEPAKADSTFGDGYEIKLGGTKMLANLTPGHTRGCTTWTTTAVENNRTYNVAFVCSTSAPGYKLVENSAYPNIASDYEKAFERLGKLKVDIFLGSHGGIFGLQGKIDHMKKDCTKNPFVDPQGFRKYLEASRADFHSKLKSQQADKGN